MPSRDDNHQPRFPQVPSCDRIDCPQAPLLYELRDDMRLLKAAIIGTAETPGLGEKFRDHDARLDALEGGIKQRKAWAITGIVTFAGALLTAAGTWVWAKLVGHAP